MRPTMLGCRMVTRSIFVTAGAVNPTSTIQALALHIAYYFKQNARHLWET